MRKGYTYRGHYDYKQAGRIKVYGHHIIRVHEIPLDNSVVLIFISSLA